MFQRGEYKKKPVMERISESVAIEPNTGCWLWLCGTVSNGYGKIGIRKNNKQRHLVAHRVAWEEINGPIPAGLELDHKCRTKLCVNPDHLEPVTHRENQRRGTSPVAAKMAQTHCIRGHEFDYIKPNGNRGCKTCRRESTRKSQAKKREVSFAGRA